MAICKPSYRVPNKMQIETCGEEKFSVLLFTNKVLLATCGDQEHHAGAASALSDSSPKSPVSLFCKPASCSWRVKEKKKKKTPKKFLWQTRRNSKSPKTNENLKSMIIVNGSRMHNLKVAGQVLLRGLTEDYSPGDSLSDSCSKELREAPGYIRFFCWKKEI